MSSPEDDTRVTPVEELFTYHIFGVPDECQRLTADPAGYSLAVTGLVGETLALSLDDLKGGFAEHSAEMILQCMTNVHWGRILVAGARLLDVVERAAPSEAAWKVALRGADGFTSDLSLGEIRDNPEGFLLAYSMNGEPLELEHGFPVRLASDGRYGYKWPKWLVEVDLVDHDFKGHYEGRRGWSDKGIRGERVT